MMEDKVNEEFVYYNSDGEPISSITMKEWDEGEDDEMFYGYDNGNKPWNL